MPLKDDLIQRTIEQLDDTLRDALRLGDEQVYDAAIREIDAMYKRHLGSTRQLVRNLASDQLLAILGSAGVLDREKAYLIASLLRAEASLIEDRGLAAPTQLQCKALDLFLEAELAGLGLEQAKAHIDELQRVLSGHDLPADTLWRQFDHQRANKSFAAAEDVLFELLERFGSTAELIQRGRAFYQELLGLSDEVLEAGGLPRDEVEEGLQALQEQLE
ncbi:MAG: hypothetical protein JSV66_17925 [Trueperaceae bacterium]|nr:MAG: hypothetical protein JSV66_17925 [Trueperaceae bacterium]